AEAEYFYEAVTRSSEYLLFTRPRIADNGAPWQPSPYWEELLRCLDISPEVYTTRHLPPLDQAASRGELLEILSSGKGNISPDWKQVEKIYPELCQRIVRASNIIDLRNGGADNVEGKFDGDLGYLKDMISNKFPLDHVWSASRLENYQTCPFNFYIRNLLGLEIPEPPGEGLDARQLGNIYHHILEGLYQGMDEDYGVQDLLRGLPAAAEKIFQESPKKERFRKTVWWNHTQDQILENLKRSLIVLEGIDSSFRFYQAEQRFGIKRGEEPELIIPLYGNNSYRLRGFIDRVDRNKNGQIRIIDYKTSGSFGFDNKAVQEGKKLQLPLYALAAQDGLNIGNVHEGFYFHVQVAEPSSFTMSSYWGGGKKGPQAAIESAVNNGWKAVLSIRDGQFKPKPPDNGCPSYCPAVKFCWHYAPHRW
ncbi:MAG: PD-(D/E)XK nuclease family protein, partial [Chloroflexi bacterium]|nr:PD-(D/E)XK nuclease family protein [Chloroflexota bacterium]